MNTVFSVQAVMGLVDSISGPLRAVRGSMGDTERAAGSLSSRMGQVAKSMLPFAAAAGIVLAALGGTAMATVDTSRALGELRSVGVTDMQAIEAASLAFSNTWAGTTRPQFIAAAYDIKSGISSLSDEGVAEFTRLAALTGKATKSTTAEMTSLFATGYGIYKEMYADLSDMAFGEVFSAGIAASVQQFKTTGGGMSQAMSTLGATAATANVPLEEQLSILGMLQATMSGSEAGTKYRALIQAAAGAGQKLGLEFMDANNQLLALPDILDALKNRYGDTLDAMEKMEIQKAFGTQEAVAVIDLLYTKTGQLTANIHDMSNAMGMGSGATARMAGTMNQDLGAVMEVGRQRFHNLLEVVGKNFVPTVMFASSVISDLTLVLQQIADTPAGREILMLTAAVASGVVALVAFAAVGSLIGMAMPFVTGVLGILAAAIMAISAPAWAVVAAVAALYLAFRNNLFGISDTVMGWWNTISLAVRGVREVFANLTGHVGIIRGELAEDIEAAGLVGLVTTASRVVFRVREFFTGLKEIPGQVSGWVTQGVNNISGFLGDIDFAAYGVKMMTTLADGIRSAVSAPVDLVKSRLGKIRNLLPFSDAKEGPLSALTASGRAMMETVGTGIMQGAPSLAGAVRGAVAGAATAMAITAPGIDAAGPPMPAMHAQTQDESAIQRPRSNAGTGSKSVVINIDQVRLDGVRDPRSFVAELQQLVEAYDV
jgi:hypothetical protein